MRLKNEHPIRSFRNNNIVYGMISLHVFDNNIVIPQGYYDNVYQCFKKTSINPAKVAGYYQKIYKKLTTQRD